MSDCSNLTAVEDIKRLKARYFRAIDGKDWNALRQIFAGDVVCDYRGSASDTSTGINVAPAATEALLIGIHDAIEGCRAGLTGAVSVHHGFMPDIEVGGGTNARGNWAMRDHVWFAPESPASELIGYGYYNETYERLNGVWRIKTLKLSRIKVICL